MDHMDASLSRLMQHLPGSRREDIAELTAPSSRFQQHWEYERLAGRIRTASSGVKTGGLVKPSRKDEEITLMSANMNTRADRKTADSEAPTTRKSVWSINATLWHALGACIDPMIPLLPKDAQEHAVKEFIGRIKDELLSKPIANLFSSRVISNALPFFTQSNTQLDLSNVAAIGTVLAFWLKRSVSLMNKIYKSPLPDDASPRTPVHVKVSSRGEWKWDIEPNTL